MKDFEINIIDRGDMSVGISDECAVHAVLFNNMAEHLKENNLLAEFETKLMELVNEYYDAETSYCIYDSDDIEAEIKAEEFYENN